MHAPNPGPRSFAHGYGGGWGWMQEEDAALYGGMSSLRSAADVEVVVTPHRY